MPQDNWENRSQGMRCKTCMYFVPKYPLASEEKAKMNEFPDRVAYGLGRCRRHAPTMSGWPAVFANDWCGNHKLDENKI